MRSSADYWHLGYNFERYGSVCQLISIERLPCAVSVAGDPTLNAAATDVW